MGDLIGENTDDYRYRIEWGGNPKKPANISRWFNRREVASDRLMRATREWRQSGKQGKRPEMIGKARGEFNQKKG